MNKEPKKKNSGPDRMRKLAKIMAMILVLAAYALLTVFILIMLKETLWQQPVKAVAVLVSVIVSFLTPWFVMLAARKKSADKRAAWPAVHKITVNNITEQAPSIQASPGSSWLIFFDFFCPPKFVEGTIKQTIADWRNEYFEAITQNRILKARWISFRYNVTMIRTLLLWKVLSVLEKVISIAKW
jgi:hypothetical protein